MNKPRRLQSRLRAAFNEDAKAKFIIFKKAVAAAFSVNEVQKKKAKKVWQNLSNGK